ncbi:DEAD/DEAH box helicase [Tessaracoccus lapidicaptus]|uniref:DEAD/DEAH box helicase n=1 Tax=Tessaracoccus lapidicaptus TaxID=1427523 RepID=UPI0033403574
MAARVQRWVLAAGRIEAGRTELTTAAADAELQLLSRLHPVGSHAAASWRVLPLRAEDEARLGSLARRNALKPLSPEEAEALRSLSQDARPALADARDALGIRKLFVGRSRRDRSAAAAKYLQEYCAAGIAAGIDDMLAKLEGATTPDGRDVHPMHALDKRVGLIRLLPASAGPPVLLHVGDHEEAIAAPEKRRLAIAQEAQLRQRAFEAGQEVRRAEVRTVLSAMPLERLRDATRGRLSLAPLEKAGIRTVQEVLDGAARLEGLQGVGPTSASRMVGAAQTLWHTTLEEMPFRIDVRARTPEATQFLRLLRKWDTVRRLKNQPVDAVIADAMSLMSHLTGRRANWFILLPGHRSVSDFHQAAKALRSEARQLDDRRVDGDPWEDFLARAADYYTLIAELGFTVEDETKGQSDLPSEVIAAVRQVELKTEHLSVNLRGYQQFAARFAVVQRRVIIGDEMGLGKTVEAIAVIAHLRAHGHHHSLVICPAAVVTNWVREVTAKSKLPSHRLHGTDRYSAFRSWRDRGGVAVTTYETLAWLQSYLADVADLGVVVVDEAHYIKNSSSQRSVRVASLLRQADRAVLMTGTPLENRVDEFRTLVRYIRPDLALDGDDLTPRRFRRQVAPAYLRRNQEDVLQELPELVEVNEWLPLSTDDMRAYRDALIAGNFMALRQAAMSRRRRSSKIQRLIEIVEEAEQNERRIIVFSHFRQVLDDVAAELPGQVFGPLTGSVPPAARQDMVDQFSRAPHGSVLVAQIVAGGVGLNIQAASVVVICEPQLKPTTEWQAIARARRMGQVHSVQVHRLLSEEGVDLRVTQLLAEKKRVFEDFARESELAQQAPEAYDISEAQLAREVLAAERERLLGVPSNGGSAAAELSAVQD